MRSRRLRELFVHQISGRKSIPVIFGVVALCFVGSTTYVNHGLAEIDQDALEVAANALPSMQRLGNARTLVFQIRFTLNTYAKAILAKQPIDLRVLEDFRARFKQEISAYRALPQFPGEDAIWRELEPFLERFDASIDPIVARLTAGDLDRALLLIADDLHPVADRTSALMTVLRDFNASRAEEATARIRERLRGLKQIAYLLDAFCVIGTLAAGILLNRGVRAYKELVDSNAELIERRAEEHLRQADRLKTLGYLAAGIAHELGTPLNVIALRAALIADNGQGDETPVENAWIIREQADRMAQIIRQLLNFARPNPPKKEQHDLRKIATHTCTLLQPIAEQARATFDVESGPPLPVDVDYGQLQQVVTNLVVNAIQAMPQGGRVDLAMGKKRVVPPGEHGGEEGDYVFLEVRDQGSGIAENVRAHLFSPFVTTKEVGEGTGLGLAISYRLVREHGGWFEVQSQVGHGSRFTVYLP